MRGWFSFQGRVGRRSVWARGTLLVLAFSAAFLLLAATAGRGSTLLLYVPFYWALLGLLTRRLHDRGRSSAFLLLLLLPVLGPLVIAFEVLLRRGTRGENRYGPDPRQAGLDHLTVA